MEGGKTHRGQKSDARSEKNKHEKVETKTAATRSKDGDGIANAQLAEDNSTTANVVKILQGMSKLSQDFGEFKRDMREDISAFKEDVKKTMKDDLAGFKKEILTQLQDQQASITEAQTRISDLESVCLDMREVMLMTVKKCAAVQEKVTDLESRSRANNVRIYGVSEGQEGNSVMDFVTNLIKEHFTLPEGVEPQIQRAHRSLAAKPSALTSPRSIVVNFLQFSVKEDILRQAWEKKGIELDGKRLYFDNDYATDVVEKRKAYGPIKATLKEKGIKFHTPYTRMRVQWTTGTKTYESAEEVARDLTSKGIQMKASARPYIPKENNFIVADIEDRLNQLIPWKHANAANASRRARHRLEEYRRQSDPN